MIDAASVAYSTERPIRLGNGTCGPQYASNWSAALPYAGVLMVPGAMVTTRMPSGDRSRAATSVIPITPPLAAE